MSRNSRASLRAWVGTMLAMTLAGAMLPASPVAAVEPSGSTTPSATSESRVQGSPVTAGAIGETAGAQSQTQVAATDAGALSGIVSEHGGGLLEGVAVEAYLYTGAAESAPYVYTATAVTDAGGAFRFDALPSGSYDLFFSPGDRHDLSWSWLGGGPSPAATAPIVIGIGQDVLAGTHVLTASAKVSGVVSSDRTGGALSGVPVTLWGGNGPDGGGISTFEPLATIPTSAGMYSFDQLPAGSYILRFDAPTASYRSEWWDGRPRFAAATVFSLADGAAGTANAGLASIVNLGTVTVAGAYATDSTLTANHSTYSGTKYIYAWYADGVVIPGARSKTFVPTAAQQHKRITVRITGSRPDLLSTSVTSAPGAKVLLTTRPAIAGRTAVGGTQFADESFWRGATLSVNRGSWTSGTTFRYQWFAEGKAIAGAVRATYTLRPVDRDKRIIVRVTGSKDGYGSFTRTSTATARVALLGTVYVSEHPQANPDKQNLFQRSVHPFVNGTFTPGATSTFYYYADTSLVLISTDAGGSLPNLGRFIGKRIKVKVLLSKPGYDTHAIWSNSTSPVIP